MNLQRIEMLCVPYEKESCVLLRESNYVPECTEPDDRPIYTMMKIRTNGLAYENVQLIQQDTITTSDKTITCFVLFSSLVKNLVAKQRDFFVGI